jgi:hypothetical protein
VCYGALRCGAPVLSTVCRAAPWIVAWLRVVAAVAVAHKQQQTAVVAVVVRPGIMGRCRPALRRGCHMLPLCSGLVVLSLLSFSHLGLRKALVRSGSGAEQKDDLQLAVRLSTAAAAEAAAASATEKGPATAGSGGSPPVSVAFLFLCQDSLLHLDLWREFFEASAHDPSGGGRGHRRLSYKLYFHFANGSAQHAAREQVARGFPLSDVEVVPTVATRWCELMAAELSLYARAWADTTRSHAKFVLLSHDSMPLQPLNHTLRELLRGRRAAQSSICFAGIKHFEVPRSCSACMTSPCLLSALRRTRAFARFRSASRPHMPVRTSTRACCWALAW